MPALVLAPPLPPVLRVLNRVRDGVPEVSSLKTSTALPAGLFVLVSTKMLRPCGPARATAAANKAATKTARARPRVKFSNLRTFIVISFIIRRECAPVTSRAHAHPSEHLQGSNSAEREEKLRLDKEKGGEQILVVEEGA